LHAAPLASAAMDTFYGCYLLESLKRKHFTYIGFTMDPRRRLRQHNGEIAAGAWKTHRARPWKMVLCVWGLPNKIAALQFEYAWQHPAVCRHVRGPVAKLGFCQRTKSGRQRMVHGTLRNMQVLFEMLQASPYCRMPLHVHILDSTAYRELLPKISAREKVPKHICITHGTFDELEHICADQILATQQEVDSCCAACSGALKTGDRVVSCPSCRCSLHVHCAAQAFTGLTGQLMPQQPGSCPSCAKLIEWPIMIRSARRVPNSAHAHQKESQEICPSASPNDLVEAISADSLQPVSSASLVILDEPHSSVGASAGCHGDSRSDPLHAQSSTKPKVRSHAECLSGGESLRERLIKKGRISASIFNM
jgi:structure-specific endonuclease subunit SLX1